MRKRRPALCRKDTPPVGAVETEVAPGRPVEQNNASNCLKTGCNLYLNPAVDVNDLASSARLYAGAE